MHSLLVNRKSHVLMNLMNNLKSEANAIGGWIYPTDHIRWIYTYLWEIISFLSKLFDLRREHTVKLLLYYFDAWTSMWCSPVSIGQSHNYATKKCLQWKFQFEIMTKPIQCEIKQLNRIVIAWNNTKHRTKRDGLNNNERKKKQILWKETNNKEVMHSIGITTVQIFIFWYYWKFLFRSFSPCSNVY